METHSRPLLKLSYPLPAVNDYRLAASVTGGASRCVGCVTTVGNGCLKAGEVIRWDIQHHAFKFGEHDNSITPRVLELVELWNLGPVFPSFFCDFQ